MTMMMTAATAAVRRSCVAAAAAPRRGVPVVARRSLSAATAHRSGANATYNFDVSFTGKTAVVTGATRGIGRATAIALSSLGADVVAIGRSGLDELAQQYPALKPMHLDLSDKDAVEKELSDLPKIDLLVNNAGITYLAPFVDHDLDRMQHSYCWGGGIL
ncbi:hypothetical protein PTSG_07859 [Salpingoeca rosetta]|uniref:Uncharacterized protein n=1 Tax=Salpingoeca rosetta (strain ATCC 50818 / BSB-021) TaxID=946362 RepID=F2UGJ3_SALR5|nr:uncharacterized protein PTSG_07859 [Salpingoeca rosetta]EGD75743.1 hypothetical protein PTSG_07859 [Salpingoeca rosetta]|eukprot:XP_004991664.1 hypothetical protein PTSG_07859 [Salpingoeca rosetta]